MQFKIEKIIREIFLYSKKFTYLCNIIIKTYENTIKNAQINRVSKKKKYCSQM